MRLNQNQIDIIRRVVREQLGNEAQVSLFGSRVDDNAKGGDIDLYIASPVPITDRVMVSAHIAARLQQRLGDQRIDIVLVDPQTVRLPIHGVAEKTGIRL